MRKDRIPKKSGDEQDALSKNRTIHGYRAGTRKWIKRHYNKKVRKIGIIDITNLRGIIFEISAENMPNINKINFNE